MSTDGDDQTLWLVRHGESTWNVLGLVQGHADEATLTRQGRRQATLVTHRLAGRPVGALYTSDLRRARETADILAESLGLEARVHPDLRERNLGAFEGSPSSTLGAEATGIDGERVVDVEARAPGGESLEELYRRAGRFVRRLRDGSSGEDAVVVAHGGTVRMIRAYCAGSPVGEVVWDAVPNGSLWRVRLHGRDAAAVPAPLPAPVPAM